MMLRFITGAMAVFALVFLDPHAGARAAGDSDPARFRLTGALLDRMEAVAADLRVSAEVDDDDDDDGEGAYEAGSDAGHDDQSVEDIALELDADPRVRAALARHGLGSREYAMAVLAALQAGMVLAVEDAPGATSMQGLTPEQRANVDLLRARRKAPR